MIKTEGQRRANFFRISKMSSILTILMNCHYFYLSGKKTIHPSQLRKGVIMQIECKVKRRVYLKRIFLLHYFISELR